MRRRGKGLRHARSEEELRKASEHLYYELWMLRETATVLALDVYRAGSIRNAVLESFLLHARNVLQFFDPTNPGPNDVLAAHFFTDGADWKKKRGRMPATVKNLSRRVAKEVAHLTYDRIGLTPTHRQWKYNEIATALVTIARVFRSAVKPGILGPEWDETSESASPI